MYSCRPWRFILTHNFFWKKTSYSSCIFLHKNDKGSLFSTYRTTEARCGHIFFHEIWCSVTIHFAHACTFTIDPRNAQSAFLFVCKLQKRCSRWQVSLCLLELALAAVVAIPVDTRTLLMWLVVVHCSLLAPSFFVCPCLVHGNFFKKVLQ